MSQNSLFDQKKLHSKADRDKKQTPRQPKPETKELLSHGIQQPENLQVVQPAKSTTLSATAPEFKPKTYQYQDGPTSYTQVPPPPLPPEAAGVPDAFVNTFRKMRVDVGDNGPLSEFTKTMFILTVNPGNLRDFLKPLCDKLRQVRSPDILNEVIDVLYDQSVFVPNFRYTGARVVHFICHELKDHAIFGHFKGQFLKKCQEDYLRRQELMESGEGGLSRLCGLTLFMGEMFQNVTADAGGKTERLGFLPSVLTDLLMTLLSEPSDMSVKTACQLLKLAGGPTEDAMAQKSAPEKQNFNSIFATLQNLQALPYISPNMQSLMKSVLDLRQRNWGRADIAENSTHENSVLPPDFTHVEPVFYNQYGKPISREEAGYQEEEEDEEYDDYVLTEEEEQDFLIWQEETSVNSDPHLALAAPGHLGNADAQPVYPESNVYPQWSTGDASYGYPDYSQNYDYSGYSSYIEDEGLNEEMEKAYDEFLSSQQGPPMGK